MTIERPVQIISAARARPDTSLTADGLQRLARLYRAAGLSRQAIPLASPDSMATAGVQHTARRRWPLWRLRLNGCEPIILRHLTCEWGLRLWDAAIRIHLEIRDYVDPECPGNPPKPLCLLYLPPSSDYTGRVSFS